MAAGGLLALLDDIAALLDDIAVMTKVAAAKTAGITGDDLAVNAEALIGIDPKRELPIVWRVAKGSFRNKLILIPSALALSAFAEWLITPLLIIGGTYLCFEAAEKIIHALHKDSGDKAHKKDLIAAGRGNADLVQMEREKIAQAVQTDFILSAEIVAVTLAYVKEAALLKQTAVLCIVGFTMTIGVYGLVAGIVKLDDLGMHLSRKGSRPLAALGRGIVRAAPWLMSSLSVIGTGAMFLVGGGILIHGIPPLDAALEGLHGPLHLLATIGIGVVLGFAAVPLAKPLVKLAGIIKSLNRKKK